jgi:hypothetical protein
MSFQDQYQACLEYQNERINSLSFTQEKSEPLVYILNLILQSIQRVYVSFCKENKNKAEIRGKVLLNILRTSIDRADDYQSYFIRLNLFCDYLDKYYPHMGGI